MPNKDTAPHFPENEVDNLIASFGRKPTNAQMTRIEETMRKEAARDKVMRKMKQRDQSRGKGRGR